MFILIEWLAAFILFFLGIGQFNTSSYYNDYYASYKDAELGVLYLLGSFLVGIFAWVHTKWQDADYGYSSRSYRNCNNTWTSNGKTTVYTSSSVYTGKSKTEVINDIVENYPKPITSINHIVEHKIKKPSFFSFKKEPDIVTSVIQIKKESNKEADLIMFNKEEERDIIYSLTDAMQGYICYEDLAEIKKHIIHAEFDDNNNVNVFFTHSDDVNIYSNLNRYCITEKMKKHLGYCEDIRFVEAKENFEDFYLEWKRSV